MSPTIVVLNQVKQFQGFPVNKKNTAKIYRHSKQTKG